MDSVSEDPTDRLAPDRGGQSTPLSCRLRRLGIDTGAERVVFLRSDSPVCHSEGFDSRSRVQLHLGNRKLIAMLDVVHGELLANDEAGLSESAWLALKPDPGDRVEFSHPPTVESLSLVRRKIYGHELKEEQFDAVMIDIAAQRYASVELAAFIVACAGGRLTMDETTGLTRSMVGVGNQLHWPRDVVVDKHCIGGLPGNRTTPIVVAIVTALGLMMPKTSSRAITSPAGTADTMEMLAPVALDVPAMRRAVERTGGCVIWGGNVNFSPADDILIRVERSLDVDSEGQLVASILSKKIAAGATHVLIDIPVGPTAKVRSQADAASLAALTRSVGARFGLRVHTLLTDGLAPVGRGVGPALEARDVMAVLSGAPDAPADLRLRALRLAAELIEMGGLAEDASDAMAVVTSTLDSGRAYRQFLAICEAQGGLRTPGIARYQQPIPARHDGVVAGIDNRRLATVAKLAGAPRSPLAGLTVDSRPGDRVSRGTPLFVLHAENRGELAYALAYVARHPDIIDVSPV